MLRTLRFVLISYNLPANLRCCCMFPAAVSSLARFGAECDDLVPSILSLLTHSMLDEDDEVRDRATFYYHTLEHKQKALNSAYILNGQLYVLPHSTFFYFSQFISLISIISKFSQPVNVVKKTHRYRYWRSGVQFLAE